MRGWQVHASRLICLIRILRKILKRQEKLMADFTRLNAAVADLSTKVDALLAKPQPVDEQPAVDAAAAAVEAIAAKIPA